MNKTEFIKELAEKTFLSQKKSGEVLEAMIEIVKDALKKEDKVSIIGFGGWEVKKRDAREGRNPQTGKKIKIAAKNVVKFKPGKALSDAVN